MFLSTDTSQNAHYATVPTISHARNSFSIEQSVKHTIQFDGLYPMAWKYMMPGDTLSGTFALMARLATQIGTLYDDLYLDAHAWFVPHRLTQTNWARYQYNAQPLGPTQDNSALTSPSIDLTGLASGFGAKSTYDYFGLFGDPSVDLSSSAAHINNYLGRSYNMIWNENYRDENLQTPVTVDLDEGPDDPTDYDTILKRGKRHNKFSSMLTAQQKGTATQISFGTSIPINKNPSSGAINAMKVINSTDGNLLTSENLTADASGFIEGATSGVNVMLDPNGSIVGDPSVLTLSTNALRTTVAVQHLLEADARGGTRDVEAIKNRWGVTVPDFTLQRPEYLGGATFDFDGQVVPQTSETGTTPQGTLKQFSQTMASLNINHSFVEAGSFMILLSARSNLTYQQGLSRELTYETRYDWYQPEFANIGEVGVLNREWYFQGDDGTVDEAIAGYQENAYELRYSDNYVTSEFRSSYATSKDYLHMADEYSSLPVLGSAWIESDTPISRNLAVSAATADPIEINAIFKGKCARTLPMFSIPGLTRL